MVDRSLTKSCFQCVVLIVCAVVALVAPVLAQGFKVEAKSDRSVVGAGPFVSIEGRFSIALPQTGNSFRPLTVETPAGRMRGDAYSWSMKEGSYTAGYVDAPLSMEDAQMTATMFANIREGLSQWAGTKNGKLVNDRQFEFEKHPGLEVKLEFPEASLWQRFYVVSSRIYQLVLAVSAEQRPHEAVALKVLDSFKLLSEAEISAALKAKAAAAEPSPLPQEPVVARVSSDAADDGLHGEVKTVYYESEDLSGTWSVQGRKPTAMEYYNKGGNLTKREGYDYKGNLHEITVYGYIDGARVSSFKIIEQSYNPPPVVVASSPGIAKPKSDSRYSNKHTFRYDDRKRLIERTWFLNNGEVSIRYVYKYTGNEVEEWAYAADGSLNQHYLSILDEKGNTVEKTHIDTRDGSTQQKYSYAYEFDAKGNWTKRVTSKWVTKDGKSQLVPEYADYRTVTYY